jgi:methionyl-tRNA formyltransferase
MNMLFFGTSELSVTVLEELEKAGFVPGAIICAEDKPVGRKMIITPPPAKVWAEARNIPVFQPLTLKEEKESGITEKIKALVPDCDLFIVASYGKIIPQAILDIPKHGTLNVHPSLLPRLRGPSPIQSAILTEQETGVSIMLLDALMDHGPLLAQEKTVVPEWPPYAPELENILAHQGGKMLAEIIPQWIAGEIKAVEQDHSKATVCKKIQKSEGLVDLLETDPYEIFRKVRAFSSWPGTFFFTEYNNTRIRVLITQANFEDNTLSITHVKPEGKKEMLYADFLRGKHS